MTDRTHQLDKIHGTLQDRGYRPVATYQQATTAPGEDGRVEYWAGSKGDRLVQVGLEHGVVTSVEVYAPLVETALKKPSRLSDGDLRREADRRKCGR